MNHTHPKTNRPTLSQLRKIALGIGMGVTLISTQSQAATPGMSLPRTIGSYQTPDGTRMAYVDGMPDLDQRRYAGPYLSRYVDGLPNSGKDHCAPTTVANVLGWITNTGYSTPTSTFRFFPDLAPDSRSWAPPSDDASLAEKRAYIDIYNRQTAFIRELGETMDTGGSPFSPILGEGGTPPRNIVSTLQTTLGSEFSVEPFNDSMCTLERDPITGALLDLHLGPNQIYELLAQGNLVLMSTHIAQKTSVGYSILSNHIEVVTGVDLPRSPTAEALIRTSDSDDELPVTGEAGKSQSSFDAMIYSAPRAEEEHLVYLTGPTASGFTDPSCSRFNKRATVMKKAFWDDGLFHIISEITVIGLKRGSFLRYERESGS